MASNKKHTNYDITKFCAFVVLLLTIVIVILEAVVPKWSAIGALSLIKEICLILVVCLAAYPFANALGKTWRTVYFVCVVVLIVMFVLGHWVL